MLNPFIDSIRPLPTSYNWCTTLFGHENTSKLQLLTVKTETRRKKNRVVNSGSEHAPACQMLADQNISTPDQILHDVP